MSAITTRFVSVEAPSPEERECEPDALPIIDSINARSDMHSNDKFVYSHIRRGLETSAAEIAPCIGASTATVVRSMKKLVALGLIKPVAK